MVLYGYVQNSPLNLNDPFGLKPHISGQWKDCGNGCRIRIDINAHDDGRHLHWECNRGKQEGAMGELGGTSHGGTWQDAPASVIDCARKFGFQPMPVKKESENTQCEFTSNSCSNTSPSTIAAGVMIVGGGLLIAADVLAFGPTGEGIVPGSLMIGKACGGF